ncbi:hypothetical protein EC957_004415 [Mortierella hygrophila]|uniref:Uncharacterized protein n=1 Tax=Mortierella hygrophila TaxID=979708 RepID=A0A9P6F0Q3_9FUNG|nr:hypothetical protein EC957_004415 [Mortierella hygrophila]
MSAAKKIVHKDPMELYAQYFKFFIDPPEAENIWYEPFKRLNSEHIRHDEKFKKPEMVERRFLGKNNDVNLLRAVRFLVHRIPDFPLNPDKTQTPFTAGSHGGPLKSLTTELSQTEPTLRGISQRALWGLYHRVLGNYRGMVHLLSNVRGDIYKTPDTIMWKAAAALSRLDALHRGEPKELNIEYVVDEDTMQHEETQEYEEEEEEDEHPSTHNDNFNRTYNGQSSAGLQESAKQDRDSRASRKRMADTTEPLEAASAAKRAQRVGKGRALSYQVNGHHFPEERRVVAASRSPSSPDLSGPEQDERHYSTSALETSRGDSRSYGQHYNDHSDTTFQDYVHSKTAPLSTSPSRNRLSHSRKTISGLFEYQDELDDTAHMEDLIRSLHRDTRIQMANMRSAIETQQAQLNSLQDTLDTILRRIPMGTSRAQHQQRQGRISMLPDTIDERYYDQEEERTHRRYGLNSHSNQSRPSHKGRR